jgi:uncharacterized membrane protein
MTDINKVVEQHSAGKSYPVFKFVRPLLAFVIVLGAFGFMYSLVYHEIPAGNKDTINLVVGFVLGILATVATYYFGTSKDKSDAEQHLRVPGTTSVTNTQEPQNPK